MNTQNLKCLYFLFFLTTYVAYVSIIMVILPSLKSLLISLLLNPIVIINFLDPVLYNVCTAFGTIERSLFFFFFLQRSLSWILWHFVPCFSIVLEDRLIFYLFCLTWTLNNCFLIELINDKKHIKVSSQ